MYTIILKGTVRYSLRQINQVSKMDLANSYLKVACHLYPRRGTEGVQMEIKWLMKKDMYRYRN